MARRFGSEWKQALMVVSPETVVRWHRSGFALYWRAICKARGRIGRRRISKEVRDLIFRMVTENPTWGAPRIHGELLMLGFDISERTVTRCRSVDGYEADTNVVSESVAERRCGTVDRELPAGLVGSRYHVECLRHSAATFCSAF
jgi:hypothetical protein